MSFVPARLRAGEIIAGIAGAAVLVDLFAVNWYRAPQLTLTGWQCYGALSWALALSGALAVAMVLTQAALRGPALAVVVDGFTVAVSSITLVWLAVRVLIAAPDGLSAQAGVWLALAAQLALVGAALLATRQEGIREADGPGEIPVISPDDLRS